MGVSPLNRRTFLASGALAAGALVTPGFVREALGAPARAGESPYGPLSVPNANGLMLPPGFSSREVARGLRPVAGTDYSWPVFPDGQAAFETAAGGWILVTNSESLSVAGAGASAIRFRPDGTVESAYRVLGGTDVNCGGGPTPWGTWLSGEEHDAGLVWECDPAGVLRARPRPALGVFTHEAAAVDPEGRRVYLTEDEPDGGLYRFTPSAYPDLSQGLLEVAVVAADGSVSWRELPNPAPTPLDTPTRGQVPEMARFNGGEGIWHAGGVLYFTTKGDGRVWALDARADRIEVLYERADSGGASLDAVDNITVSAAGEVFVCEDSGNMEIGLITPERTVSPFLRFSGHAHSLSEVCGVVFDPSGTRLYCTSQGAYTPGGFRRGPGAVYEISGPFRLPPGGMPVSPFGLPAGERRDPGPLGRAPRGPRIELKVARRTGLARLLRRGLVIEVESNAHLDATVAMETPDLRRRPGQRGSTPRPRTVVLARRGLRLERERPLRLRLRVGPRPRRLLRRGRTPLTIRVLVTGLDASGRRGSALARVTVGSGWASRRRGA